MRRLANAGQAVLCTIHQPSAILFQEFDQLLFLARGGKTVYFGPIGKNSQTVIEYFSSHGGRECGESENPAEYMLETVNAGSNNKGQDWHEVWKQSQERASIEEEIDRIHEERRDQKQNDDDDEDPVEASAEFAMPLWFQLYVVTYRVFQQYWRMPTYIYSKFGLALMAGLFIGFSFFNSNSSLQGLQNVIFSAFMICALFSSLAQQVRSYPINN